MNGCGLAEYEVKRRYKRKDGTIVEHTVTVRRALKSIPNTGRYNEGYVETKKEDGRKYEQIVNRNMNDILDAFDEYVRNDRNLNW